MLIADDQKRVGNNLAALVEKSQHEVVEVVGTGLEAIHAYTRHRPDVVLMDYSMPRLNGATACRIILARDPAVRDHLPPDDLAGLFDHAYHLVHIHTAFQRLGLRTED